MHKAVVTFAFVIGLLLIAILSLVGLAQLAVIHQPVVNTAGQIEDLPTDNQWVKVRMDERMFTLFAALNAAGFDKEFPGMTYHPVRQLVRERLSGKQFSGQERLRAELKFIDSYSFVVWALHYSQPPEFSRVEAVWSESGMPAFLFFGLDRLLRNFYEEMDIAELWQEVRPQYEQEAARYQAAAGQAIQDVIDYTRRKDVPLKQVVVIPNLLTGNWNGNGPTVGDTAYVVMGPTEDKVGVGLIQHEALHSIAGPLVEANLNAIDEKHSTELYAELSKRVPSSYGSWESIVEEHVVRAIECRLSGVRCEQYLLRNDEEEGFLLERTLLYSLESFEQSNSTLAEFMPELLATINDIQVPLE